MELVQFSLERFDTKFMTLLFLREIIVSQSHHRALTHCEAKNHIGATLHSFYASHRLLLGTRFSRLEPGRGLRIWTIGS